MAFQDKVPLPLAHFLDPTDRDVMFYNEVYHYLRSGVFPDGASETDKKVIRKRSTNYMVRCNSVCTVVLCCRFSMLEFHPHL